MSGYLGLEGKRALVTGTTERYSAEPIHDYLLPTLIVRAGLFCEPRRQPDRCFRFDPAG
jgi:hypothetical protein